MKHFKGKANLICIGENTKQRSFLTKYKFEDNKYINETMDILSWGDSLIESWIAIEAVDTSKPFLPKPSLSEIIGLDL